MTTKNKRVTGISPSAVIAMEKSIRHGMIAHRIVNTIAWVCLALATGGVIWVFTQLVGK